MSLSLDEVRLLLLSVGYAVHDGDWNWKDVNSPFMRLYYVTEGSAKMELRGRCYELKPNHLYLIPPFVTHSCICNSRFCHYYLHIYEESTQNLFDFWELPFELAADDVDMKLVNRLCEMNPFMRLPQSNPATYDNEMSLKNELLRNKQRTFGDRLESRGILFMLVSRFISQAKPISCNLDSRIEDALKYICEHLYENANINMIADHVCLSNDHFIRLFKTEMGVTPLQYINRKKIEKAQLLLLSGDFSVKNVAYTLGFEDCSYFNRLFKKMVGTTPQEYRRICG